MKKWLNPKDEICTAYVMWCGGTLEDPDVPYKADMLSVELELCDGENILNLAHEIRSKADAKVALEAIRKIQEALEDLEGEVLYHYPGLKRLFPLKQSF